MMSETVVLRKEIHALHEQIDTCQGGTQCMIRAVVELSTDLAEEKAVAKRYKEQRDEESKRADDYLRRVKVLEHLLEDNNILFDTERMAKECRIRTKRDYQS